MKAGIYMTPTHIICVAKDRSIRCGLDISTRDFIVASKLYREEYKLSTRKREMEVEFEDGTIGVRVSDVPADASNPQLCTIMESLAGPRAADTPSIKTIAQWIAATNAMAEPVEGNIVDMPKREPSLYTFGSIGKRGVDYGICGKQSARKHRKAGHSVMQHEDGSYTWNRAS